MSAKSSDVVIIGAGLAGLTLALQLKRNAPTLSIVVLERRCFPYPEATHKVGESTVELAAHYLSETLGLKHHLQTDQLRKLGIRMFFASGDNSRVEMRLEMGSNRHFYVPTYQIDRGRFENMLVSRVSELGVEVLSSSKVGAVELSESGDQHRMEFVHSDATHTITARWVVDASGRAAVIKKRKELKQPSDHDANAVWFRMRSRIDIDDWSDRAGWRDEHEGLYSRWYSTNHLTGEGYWVWLIPLASGYTSIGIVTDPAIHPLSEFRSFDDCLVWLKRYEPQLAREVEAHSGELADYIAIKHYAHKCSRVLSPDRWAVTGDAGVFIDPLYSPGSDFIAIQNTFITDVITRDTTGERFVGRAELYNDLFMQLTDNVLKSFHQQYSVFGNPRIMPLKVVWDYAVYWGFIAFIVNQGRLCDISALRTIESALHRVYARNEAMQALFREAHKVDRSPVEPGFFDIAKVPDLLELNRLLTVPHSDEEFLSQLQVNMETIEETYQRLSYVIRECRGGWSSAPELLEALETAPQQVHYGATATA
ncbi:MAG: NAD(P)/FAD-dependent oxidoreductase [Pseudomonadota bacterium]|jgi:flavin-dependent dehydrogenase